MVSSFSQKKSLKHIESKCKANFMISRKTSIRIRKIIIIFHWKIASFSLKSLRGNFEIINAKKISNLQGQFFRKPTRYESISIQHQITKKFLLTGFLDVFENLLKQTRVWKEIVWKIRWNFLMCLFFENLTFTTRKEILKNTFSWKQILYYERLLNFIS